MNTMNARTMVLFFIVSLFGCSSGAGYQPRDGDIIFHASRSTQSEAVQRATKSTYSHMGIVCLEDGEPLVFEAVEPVKFTPLADWIARGEDAHFVIKRLKNAEKLLTPEALKQMAKVAGGAPVWKEAAQAGGWTVVNFEQIAAWDPDQIYVVSYQADSAEIVANLRDNPQWQALQAVQNGAIYGFPGDIFSWDQPEPRWILGVTWLAGKMQPDLLPDLDMQQEAVEFFSQLYGMDGAAVEATILPRLKGNVE